MQKLPIIGFEFITHGIYFLVLLIFILIALVLAYTPFSSFMQRVTSLDLKSLRLYLTSLLLTVITFIVYWIIDVQFIDLPDPIFPFTFYVLIFTINFGLKLTFWTVFLSFFLAEFYLYEPRYDLNPSDHLVNSFFTILGLISSLYIGQKIRMYQQQLLRGTENLQTLIHARDQFAAVMAHDLKNPITTIKLYSQNLERKHHGRKPTAVISNAAQSIDQETNKMLSLIDLLLDFSKLQSKKLVLHKERINIIPLCKKVVTNNQMLYSNHRYIFRSKLRRLYLSVDPISFDRILSNLLSNAAKYSPPNTKIPLDIRKVGKKCVIVIKDAGIGISEEDQEHLFEPFFQSSTSRNGLGLGLYIVKALVELHKGTISLDSQIGKGTTFTLSFPLDSGEN